MLAHAEAQVGVRLAIDPEAEGILEDLLVPIRRGVEEGYRVALADRLAAQLVVRVAVREK